MKRLNGSKTLRVFAPVKTAEKMNFIESQMGFYNLDGKCRVAVYYDADRRSLEVMPAERMLALGGNGYGKDV